MQRREACWLKIETESHLHRKLCNYFIVDKAKTCHLQTLTRQRNVVLNSVSLQRLLLDTRTSRWLISETKFQVQPNVRLRMTRDWLIIRNSLVICLSVLFSLLNLARNDNVLYLNYVTARCVPSCEDLRLERSCGGSCSYREWKYANFPTQMPSKASRVFIPSLEYLRRRLSNGRALQTAVNCESSGRIW